MQDDNAPWQDPQDLPNASANDVANPRADEIDFDLSCIRCGYNLRGQLPTGSCPECGDYVATTLRPDLLHYANTGWLDSLRKGSNWLIAAILMNLAMIPIGMVVGAVSAASASQSQSNPTLSTPALIILTILGLIITGTYGVAVWLITTPETQVIVSRPSRSIARWLIVPAMILNIVAELFKAGNTTAMIAVGGTFEVIGSIMLLVGFLAGLLYLRGLADRIPEPSLAKQTMTVFWGYLVTMSIFILFTAGFLIFTLFATTSGTTPNVAAGAIGVFGLVFCPVILAMLVFVIWWIVLAFRYRTRFTQAHEIALSQR